MNTQADVAFVADGWLTVTRIMARQKNKEENVRVRWERLRTRLQQKPRERPAACLEVKYGVAPIGLGRFLYFLPLGHGPGPRGNLQLAYVTIDAAIRGVSPLLGSTGCRPLLGFVV